VNLFGEMGWVGGTLLYLISLAVLGCGEADKTGITGLFKEPGETQNVQEPFKLNGVCNGSVTLKNAKGNVQVVKNSELNVNFKPESIELLGKFGLLYQANLCGVCDQLAVIFT